MNWLELLRSIRAAQCRAFADHDRVGGNITAQVGDDGAMDVRIVGPIDWWFGVDVLAFADELLDASPTAVNLYVDSPGGDLFDAMALRAAFDSLDGVIIRAQAGAIVGSAAVPVFLAAAERSAQGYTRFMVHNPRVVFVAAGTMADIDSAVLDFRGTMDAATGLYWDAIASHVDQSIVDDWRASNSDVWLTSTEAHERGILTGAAESDPTPAPEAAMDPRVARAIRGRVQATLLGR